MCATLRSTQNPSVRSPTFVGMDIMDQGKYISTLQPSSVTADAPRHGPSHSRENDRSAATLPSASEPPRATVNQ